MLHKISEALCQRFITRNVISESERPVIVYGLEIILSTSFITLTILILSCLLASPVFCGLFLAFFVMQRFFVGGYHCTTYLHCFLTSNALFLAVLFVALVTPTRFQSALSVLLTVVSLPIAYLKAPVLNKNNPLSAKRIARDRRIGRRTVVFQAFFIIVSVIFSWMNLQLVYFSALSYFLVMLLMLPKSS